MTRPSAAAGSLGAAIRWAQGALVLGALAMAAGLAGCGLEQADPLPPHTFAFGVFGDGPYRSWEMGRYKRVLKDAGTCDLAWFLHVGDILWFPCSDKEYRKRLDSMNSLPHPVVYTPGDNEWADCHESIPGGFDPLDRLERIRAIFYPHPDSSLGGRRMPLDTQAAYPGYGEFVENAMWTKGGFLFATVHTVGTANGRGSFRARTAAHDEEVSRREAAGVAWIDEAFSRARADSASGVILAMHANPFGGYDGEGPGPEPGFEPLVNAMAEHTAAFPGPVMLIHGDTHTFRVDQPLLHPETGEPLQNFRRLETFGSPHMGWVRVVVDSVKGRIVTCETRTTPDWWLL